MRWINADKVIHAQVYDDEHEEWSEREMTIEKFLDAFTDEGCPTVVTHPEQKWISCNNQLPKYPKRKQVQLSNGWVITAYFELGDWYAVPPLYDEDDIYISLKEAGYRVIAWHELPEPWKGEEHG